MEPNRPTGLMRYMPAFVVTAARAVVNFFGRRVAAIKTKNQNPRETPREPTPVYTREVVNLAKESCSVNMPAETCPTVAELQGMPPEQLAGLLQSDAKLGGKLLKRFVYEDSEGVANCLKSIPAAAYKKLIIEWGRNRQAVSAEDIPLLWKMMNFAFPEGFRYVDPEWNHDLHYTPYNMVLSCAGQDSSPQCVNRLLCEQEAGGMLFGDLMAKIINDIGVVHAMSMFNRDDELKLIESCQQNEKTPSSHYGRDMQHLRMNELVIAKALSDLTEDSQEYAGMLPLIGELDKIMFHSSGIYNQWAKEKYGVDIGALGLQLTEVASQASTEQIRQLVNGTTEEKEALLREIGWHSYVSLPGKKPEESDLVKEMLYLHFTGELDAWGNRVAPRTQK